MFLPLILLIILLGFNWIPPISRILLWALGIGLLYGAYSTMIWINLRFPQSSFLSWGILNLCIFAGSMVSIMGLIILVPKYTPAYSQEKSGVIHYFIANSNGKKYTLQGYKEDGLFLKKENELSCNNQTFEQCVKNQ